MNIGKKGIKKSNNNSVLKILNKSIKFKAVNIYHLEDSLKKLILITFLFSFIVVNFSNGGVDENEVKEKLSLITGQTNAGSDFWFTIPPAYTNVNDQKLNNVKILVASSVKASVYIEIEGKGYKDSLKIEENELGELVLDSNIAFPIIYDFESKHDPKSKISKKSGIHVYSDSPIVLYVMIRFGYTTDGFLAIPTSSLGQKYIAMSYQDAKLRGVDKLFPPFTGITSAYDNNKINFTMGGGNEGNDYLTLESDIRINTGESTEIVLDKGDVWLLTDSKVLQDLSGSLFESEKPISVVSGLSCANFPVGNSWCDYTVEMESPTESWGKHYYVTPNKDRVFNGIVRVYASEDNTTVFRNGVEIGKLTKGGGASIDESYLETRLWKHFDNNGNPVSPKIATIHADKPINVMYYNTGTYEDGKGDSSDVYMLMITPVEQFTNNILCFVPNSEMEEIKFDWNNFNVVFELQSGKFPDDLLLADMSKNPIDWKNINNFDFEDLEIFEIPYEGNQIGSLRLKLGTTGIYGFKSTDSKFAVHAYGGKEWEYYGLPAGRMFSDLSSGDLTAPILNIETNSSEINSIEGTLDDTHGNSSGISKFEIIDGVSNNYKLEISIPNKGVVGDLSDVNEFIPGVSNNLNWTLTKVDNEKEGLAVIYYSDKSGNDSLVFFGDNYTQTNVAITNTFNEFFTYNNNNIYFESDNVLSKFNSVDIYNLSGQKVLSSVLNSEILSVSGLETGSYMIVLIGKYQEPLTGMINIIR